MIEEEIFQASREAFDAYATMDAPAVPPNRISALQVRLFRWQQKNFPLSSSSDAHPALGIVEELGEGLEAFLGFSMASGRLAKTILKTNQQIRGFSDKEKARRAIADGIADMIIYAIQLCTAFRLDFGALLEQTAEAVMERDWVLYPDTGFPPPSTPSLRSVI